MLLLIGTKDDRIFVCLTRTCAGDTTNAMGDGDLASISVPFAVSDSSLSSFFFVLASSSYLLSSNPFFKSSFEMDNSVFEQD